MFGLTVPSLVQMYRHPSCLVKHRWEHTPQWREASKFMLSKHQQVQVLEVRSLANSFMQGLKHFIRRQLSFIPDRLFQTTSHIGLLLYPMESYRLLRLRMSWAWILLHPPLEHVRAARYPRPSLVSTTLSAHLFLFAHSLRSWIVRVPAQ